MAEFTEKMLLYQGTDQEKATQIRNWMENNTQVLDNITVLRLWQTRSNLRLGKGLTKIPPEITHFHRLKQLDLRHNRINSLEGVTFPESLQDLNLQKNRITSLEGITFPESLQDLNLSENQITSLEGITFPASLEKLYLQRNQINSLEEITFPASLQQLHLHHNILNRLPDSIFNLSRCVIGLEYNNFSQEDVHAIQARLSNTTSAPRIHLSINDNLNHTSSIDTLTTQLASWKKEFTDQTSRINETAFNELTNVEKTNLCVYLQKLRQTKDYKTLSTRPNVVQRVYNMLVLAGQNSEFREQMLAAVSEGLHTCGDRTLIIFNDIEVLWHIYREEKTPENIRKWAIKIQRYEELKIYARQKVRELHLTEEIETILYFCIHLKNRLNLPITTNDMLYPACSQVTKQMLEEAYKTINSFSEKQLLQRSNFWQNYQTKNKQTETANIHEKYTNILELTEEYFQKDTVQQRQDFLNDPADCLKKELKDLIDQNPSATDYVSMAQVIQQKRAEAISTQSLF